MAKAVKQFYSAQDIMAILGCGKSYANNLMHMFEQRGQLLKAGRLLRVSIKDFEAWVKEQTKTAEEVKKYYAEHYGSEQG